MLKSFLTYNGYESYEGNYDNIAVFNSTQIKLADGTNTSFRLPKFSILLYVK